MKKSFAVSMLAILLGAAPAPAETLEIPLQVQGYPAAGSTLIGSNFRYKPATKQMTLEISLLLEGSHPPYVVPYVAGAGAFDADIQFGILLIHYTHADGRTFYFGQQNPGSTADTVFAVTSDARVAFDSSNGSTTLALELDEGLLTSNGEVRRQNFDAQAASE